MNRAEKKEYYRFLELTKDYDEEKDPTPADPTAQILLKYYDHRYDYIYAKPKKRTGKLRWKTEKRHPLLKRNLWIDWNREDTIIGLGFGYLTRRIVLDIDINSPYHPDNDEDGYIKILHTMEDIGLCSPIVNRSSWSGGLHISYFLADGVPSYKAAVCVYTSLKNAGFRPQNGHLETFPNIKSYGDNTKGEYCPFRAHRLPLQPGTGSCILNPFTLEYKGESLKKFAHMAETSAKNNDVEHFERMIHLCLQSHPIYWENQRNRYKVREWRRHLVDFIEEGWTGHHQTNVLLGKIAILCHVFEQQQGEELITAIKELALSLPGYYQYCRHQHEIDRKCKDWAKSVQTHYRMLYQAPERQENYTQMFKRVAALLDNKNDKKAQETSSKIKQVYDYLRQTNTPLPQKIGELSQLIIKTAKELTGEGISKNTLFKQHNLALWHPEHLIEGRGHSAEGRRFEGDLTSPEPFDSNDKDFPSIITLEVCIEKNKRIFSPQPDTLGQMEIEERIALEEKMYKTLKEYERIPQTVVEAHNKTIQTPAKETKNKPQNQKSSSSNNGTSNQSSKNQIKPPKSKAQNPEKDQDNQVQSPKKEAQNPEKVQLNPQPHNNGNQAPTAPNNASHEVISVFNPQPEKNGIINHPQRAKIETDIAQENLIPKTEKSLKDEQKRAKPILEKEQSRSQNQSENKQDSTPPQGQSVEESKKHTDKSIVQENRQSEARIQESSKDYPTPCEVICENGQKSQSPEAIAAEDSSDSSHTLPLMKCDSVRNLPRGGESLYQKVQGWFNSGQKLRNLRMARGLVQVPIKPDSHKTHFQLRVIEEGEVVVITSIDSSSCWFHPEDEQNLIVYITPYSIKGQWQQGVIIRALDLEEIEECRGQIEE